MTAANGWATVIDNVSSISDWFSDALCKVVTGDGWVRRTLYTNGDVSVLSFRRVVVLTSIDAGAMRGDLGERLVLVDLQAIPPERRRSERQLDAEYRALRAPMLGALLDLLAAVLARIDSVETPLLPRMADFARVLAAMDAVLGTDALGAYTRQADRIADDVIESDPVGSRLASWAIERGEWSGSASDLLAAIQPADAGRDWPRTGRGMAARLKRLAPALELLGVRVTPPSQTNRTRTWVLQAIARTAQPPCSPASNGLKLADPSLNSIAADPGASNPPEAMFGRSGDSGTSISIAGRAWGKS
jgi:hypothetical protein